MHVGYSQRCSLLQLHWSSKVVSPPLTGVNTEMQYFRMQTGSCVFCFWWRKRSCPRCWRAVHHGVTFSTADSSTLPLITSEPLIKQSSCTGSQCALTPHWLESRTTWHLPPTPSPVGSPLLSFSCVYVWSLVNERQPHKFKAHIRPQDGHGIQSGPRETEETPREGSSV